MIIYMESRDNWSNPRGLVTRWFCTLTNFPFSLLWCSDRKRTKSEGNAEMISWPHGTPPGAAPPPWCPGPPGSPSSRRSSRGTRAGWRLPSPGFDSKTSSSCAVLSAEDCAHSWDFLMWRFLEIEFLDAEFLDAGFLDAGFLDAEFLDAKMVSSCSWSTLLLSHGNSSRFLTSSFLTGP